MKKEMRYPDGSCKFVDGFDIKKLISDSISFVDSKSELLIQATDILAGFMRRSLRNKNCDLAVLKTLGRLMIQGKIDRVPQTVRLISLGDGREVEPTLGSRIKQIASSGRAMLKPERA